MTDNQDISLLDYFAAKTMQTIISTPQITGMDTYNPEMVTVIATVSYEVAESMLAEREKVLAKIAEKKAKREEQEFKDKYL